MTNRERILNLIRSNPGLTDSEIRRKTGIQTHQQVNQICRKLVGEGLVRRSPGREGKLVNLPVKQDSYFHPTESIWPRAKATTHLRRKTSDWNTTEVPLLLLSQTLFVIPCSGSKRDRNGCLSRPDVSILNTLPQRLATELTAQRAMNAAMARVDESRLVPAAERYTGYLYQAAGSTFDDFIAAGAHVVIISGGYGVVLAEEPIGWYEQQFRNSMWPNGLVGRSLAAYAEEVNANTIVGLFSATTEYWKAFRKTQWPESVAQVFQLSPETTTGALVKAPRAQGEALKEIARHHRLRAGWKSGDGLQMLVCRVI